MSESRADFDPHAGRDNHSDGGGRHRLADMDRAHGPYGDVGMRGPTRGAGSLRSADASAWLVYYSRGAIVFSTIAVFLALVLTMTSYVAR